MLGRLQCGLVNRPGTAPRVEPVREMVALGAGHCSIRDRRGSEPGNRDRSSYGSVLYDAASTSQSNSSSPKQIIEPPDITHSPDILPSLATLQLTAWIGLG